MLGAAGFSLTAVATLTSGFQPGEMSAAASFTFSAIGVLTDPNAYAPVVDWLVGKEQSTAQPAKTAPKKKKPVLQAQTHLDAADMQQDIKRLRIIEDDDEIIMALVAQFITSGATQCHSQSA
jgi:hypothetical protein